MNLIKFILPLCLAVLAGCASAPQQQAAQDNDPVSLLIARSSPPPQRSNRATLLQARMADSSRIIDLTRPASDAWERIRLGFAIPNLDTPLVQKWTDYYAAHPEYVQRMADRAGKYLYHILDEIDRRGLPTELALLPFVESAYNPDAYSRAHASGLWQFVPATGQNFNLNRTGGVTNAATPSPPLGQRWITWNTCSNCRATGTWRWPRTTGEKARYAAPWPATKPTTSRRTTCR